MKMTGALSVLALVAASALGQEISVAGWLVKDEVSPIDDSRNVTLMKAAEAPETRNRLGESRALVIRCKERRTEVYISWGDYLGLEETGVLTRHDAQGAATQAWRISSDHQATFYPWNPVEYARRLSTHQKLVAQVTPYGENPVLVTFDLTGLAEALHPLQDACRWPEPRSP